MRRWSVIIAGFVIWASIVIGTLPGYKHTDIFFVNLYDPEAFFTRLKELALMLAIVIPASVIMNKLPFPVRLMHQLRQWAGGIAGVISVVLTVFLLYYGFILWKAVPRIPDSIAYLFQAKIFAAGRLWAPVPDPFRPFDYMFTLVTDGRYISRYSPGFPILLAAGYRLMCPWAVTPVFAGAAAWLMYRLYGLFFNNHLYALMMLLLLSISPYYLGISPHVLTHSPALFFFLLFLLFGIKSLNNGRWLHASVSGASAGYFFLIRPMSAITLALPFAVYFVIRLWIRKQKKAALFLVLSGSIISGVQLAYNEMFTGSILKFPFHEGEFGQLDRLGFYHRIKWDVWPEAGMNQPFHTPLKALKNIHLCLSRINRALFGWPSSLWFIPLAFVCANKNHRKWEWLLASGVMFMMLAYALYWFPGAGLLGARYYYEALPALLFLTVRGFSGLQEKLKSTSFRTFKWFPFLFVLASTIHGTYAFWPTHIKLTLAAFGDSFEPRYAKIENETNTPSLVFIAGDTTSYSFGFFANDIYLKNPVIYARDLGPEKNAAVINKFSKRQPYLFQFDTHRSRLLPLEKDGRFRLKSLRRYQQETEIQDEFDILDAARWSRAGRAQKIINADEGILRIKGRIPPNMYPGSNAEIVYMDVPYSNLEASAIFQARNIRDINISLTIDNGRYLDEFQDLAGAVVSFVGPVKEMPPFYLFSFKGLGYKWHSQGFPPFGNEYKAFHKLRVIVDAASSEVKAFVDDRYIGRGFIPFRSSVVKIKLGVYHDGFEEREAYVILDRFTLEYTDERFKHINIEQTLQADRNEHDM
ncbi:glycosyltransferase family 39 protein [bacterium]|nr:glycosyltransferase family 39 protein [candidate division CSSED10-310 bacterium]